MSFIESYNTKVLNDFLYNYIELLIYPIIRTPRLLGRRYTDPFSQTVGATEIILARIWFCCPTRPIPLARPVFPGPPQLFVLFFKLAEQVTILGPDKTIVYYGKIINYVIL
jgi:hypothetical protein